MNLFEDIEVENDKFINVLDALKVAAKKISYGVDDIARRLLLDDFNKSTCMFKMNEYQKIDMYCSERDFQGDYLITTEFLKLAVSTAGSFKYTETSIYDDEYEKDEEDWLDYFWLKTDFFNFSSIKKIGLSEKYYKNYLKNEDEKALYDSYALLDKWQHESFQKKKAKEISEIFLQEASELNPDMQPETISNPQNEYTFYLFRKPLLSIHEAACILSEDNPNTVERCRNDTNFDKNFSNYIHAYDFVYAAIIAKELVQDNSQFFSIKNLDFKRYLFSQNIIIKGFNEDLELSPNDVGQPNVGYVSPDDYMKYRDELLLEVEKLKAEKEELNNLLKKSEYENTELCVDIKVMQNSLERLKIENQQLTNEIEKLNNLDTLDNTVEKLTGLAKRNQAAQDRQGMARIIAMSLWEQDRNIRIGVMADKVYKEMLDYCKEDLPELTESIKAWIRPVATEEAQKKGRPKSNI